MAVIADELLQHLRTAAGAPDLTYADPPQKFGGGFFTENHGFRLANAPAGWDAPLVLRLFPNQAPDELAHREAAIQSALTDQGFPAAPVVWFDADARVDGRRCFVMGRIPGEPLLGDVGFGVIVKAFPALRRMPEITAEAQVRLHQQDASALVREFDDDTCGVGRWFLRLAERADDGAPGLAPALQWLVDNRPPAPPRPSICHCDLWAGNIMMSDGKISGILDWTTGTVGEPALDVGCTALAFSLVPIEMPERLRGIVTRVGRGMFERYVRAYKQRSDADLRAQPYYEALRCAGELGFVAEWRVAEASGNAHDLPRPTWELIPDEMIEFFRARTGVVIELPSGAA